MMISQEQHRQQYLRNVPRLMGINHREIYLSSRAKQLARVNPYTDNNINNFAGLILHRKHVGAYEKNVIKS